MIKSTIALALASATVIAVAGTTASAGHYGWGGTIDQRQARQEKRIRDGVKRGLLTHWEVRKLRSEQRDIAELESCLRKVGGYGLQAYERRVLQRLLTIAHKNIVKLKQNSNRRRYSSYRGRHSHGSHHARHSNRRYGHNRR